MILSMTGFGRARASAKGMTVDAEIRSVNHRYLKLKVVAPDALAAREAELESLVRESVRRGAVQLTIVAGPGAAADAPRLNLDVLKAHLRQVRAAQRKLGVTGEASLGVLLTLPQVWAAGEAAGEDDERTWTAARKAVAGALGALADARTREGRGIQKACLSHLDRIDAAFGRIRERAPSVVPAFQNRLRERVQALVADAGVAIQPADLLREVALFADRCDIAEELQRLEAHLAELRRVLATGGEVGRRLDFLSQEILRETNTVGVKANDYAISAAAVEMKADLEKIKEQIENIE